MPTRSSGSCQQNLSQISTNVSQALPIQDKLHEASYYTTFTNFSMIYHLMCKVYTDVGGIK